MNPELLDAAARAATYVVGGGIFLNVLDDLFVDARYFLGGLDRRRSRTVSEGALRNVEQKRIAIMLPAWQEAEVIEHMLEHNLGRIDYDRDRYDIFCGTYQNDPQTQRCVEAAGLRFPNVHKVVVPHDGPTSKADCLNWVYQGVILEEQKRGCRYDILLMHDAEDVVHPLALRLYSLLIPPNEFVQTPVFSLPLPKTSLVAATYIDEFVEHHLKDMRVREALGGLIPSAGVGSAFDRDAFEQIAAAHGQHPFNVESLTEDYEIGLKFRLANRRTHFACRTVERHVNGRTREEFIATREFFPGALRASIRQRSRWILGITIQTWAQLGWRGALPVLYCLFRDRKALLTTALLAFAYLLVAYVATREVVGQITGNAWSIDHIVPVGSLLAWMLALNFAMAAWRIGLKALFVGRLYGLGHALLTAPRLVLANVIAICATVRAVTQYVGHRLSGKPLRWLKTAHEFPCPEAFAAVRRRLGEYLLEQRALSETDLDEALTVQRATGARLGDLLQMSGMVPAHAITAALGRQLECRTVDPNPDTIALGLLRRLPEALAEEMGVLPLEAREDAIVVAAVEPLDAAARRRLETVLGAPVEVHLAPSSAIRNASERAYRRLVDGTGGGVFDDLGLRLIRVSEVDALSVSKLGIGFCAFHGVVPLKRSSDGETRVACATALHETVLATLGQCLGEVPLLISATPGAVRFALASIARSIPAVFGRPDFFGLDAVEWRALRFELSARLDVLRDALEARAFGLSPLDYVEKSRTADPHAIARVRARMFGLAFAESPGVSAAGLLPPRLASSHDVTLLKRDAQSLELASPRPTPRLAQEVAALVSPLKVSWSVVPNGGS